ncbi:MAG TPA: pyridoxal phosphate-dependent aminotransferase, partial [Albitalea sp.]
MSFKTPHIDSRLPAVGTTIFTVMSALAQEHGAVNLGQGFPDFDCDPRLIDAVDRAMRQGLNQYPPMTGVPALREAVSAKIEALYGRRYDPVSEITVTAGATQGILTAILAIVHPGDEVIVLDPCYDSYEPNITLAGGRAVHVPLTPRTFRPDFDRIRAALTPRTRAIVVNTPHNPSATVWTAEEMRRLAELLRPTDVLVVSDEVYEHMVYDGAEHQSVARFPELAARSFIVSSFGKTYHVTGWKVGYVAAPAALAAEFRKVHQFNVFTVNTPMQHALARYMADPTPHLELPAFYQRKRDLFREGLAASRFELLPSEGSYFQCVDYSAIDGTRTEESFCRWLTTEAGVAAIP